MLAKLTDIREATMFSLHAEAQRMDTHTIFGCARVWRMVPGRRVMFITQERNVTLWWVPIRGNSNGR